MNIRKIIEFTKYFLYKNMFLSLLFLRIFNSFQLKTLFEPDETYQYIDPINYLILKNTNLTWDWVCGIRSFLLSLIYYIPSLGIKYLSKILSEYLEYHWTELFIVINFYNIKVVNGLMATCIDYFTIQVAEMAEINLENIVWITIISPINWLYNPRSHINNFETFCLMATLYLCMINAITRGLISSALIYIFMCLGTYIRPMYLILACAHLKKFLFNQITDDICVVEDDNMNAKTDVNPNDKAIEMYASKEYVDNQSYEIITNNPKQKFTGCSYEESEKDTNPTFIGCSHSYKKELDQNREVCLFNIFKILFILLILFIGFISVDSVFYNEPIIPPLNFLNLNIREGLNKLFGHQPFYFYLLMLFPLYNIDLLILIKELVVFIKRLLKLLKYSEKKEGRELQVTFYQLIIGLTFVGPPVVYLIIHSCVPHKELRFMLPMIPLLNIFLANSKFYKLTPTRLASSLIISYFIIQIGRTHQNYKIIDTLVLLMNKYKTHNIFICTVPYQHPISLLIKDKVRTLTGNPNIKRVVKDIWEYKHIGTFKVNEYWRFLRSLDYNLNNLIKYHKYKYIVIDDDILEEGYYILKKYYKIIASSDFSFNILGNWMKKQYIIELRNHML